MQEENEKEAKRRLDTEVMHQTEEAKMSVLAKKMMSDAKSNKPSTFTSCANLLNNFQGKLCYAVCNLLLFFIYIFLFYTGSFKNLKRNFVKVHDNLLKVLQDRAEERKEREGDRELIKELREEVKLLNFKRNDKSIPVGNTFPIASQQQIYDFLDESDGKYQARCQGFYEYLFLIRNEDVKKFGDALLGCLFTKEYQENYHWPCVL